jgi:hypothetical protein
MRLVASNNERPNRRFVWISLSVLVAVVAALTLSFSRRVQTTAVTKPANVSRSYRDRSLLRPVIERPSERPLGIQGNVYGAGGEALSGATVFAATFDRAGNMPSQVGVTRSDSKGHFEIPLQPGTYQLNATMPGHGPTSITAQSGDTVSMVLPQSGVLQGHVLDERGRPVQGFTIDIVSVVPGDAPAPPPAWSKTFESADGLYRADQVPSWPVVVRAVADGRAPFVSTPFTLQPGDTRDLDITLAEGCTLSGKVRDAHGTPLGRVLVNVEERVTAGSATDPTFQTSTQAESADDGSFTLEHVPRRTVLVRGYDGDHAVTTTTVDVGECDEQTPVVLTMSAGGAVEGVARRADGTPLAGARVSLSDRSVGFVNTASDRDGRFRFDAISEGDMRLELEDGGQRAVTYVRVRNDETVTQDMTLFDRGNAELRGHVTAGGKPIAGARLLVASNHGRQQGIAMYFPVTGPDGGYHVESLPEGHYLVSVMSTMASRGVQVRGGEATFADFDAGFARGADEGRIGTRR